MQGPVDAVPTAVSQLPMDLQVLTEEVKAGVIIEFATVSVAVRTRSGNG